MHTPPGPYCPHGTAALQKSAGEQADFLRQVQNGHLDMAEHSVFRVVLHCMRHGMAWHVLGWRPQVICEFYTENSGNLSFFPKHGKQWDWKSEATPGARGAGRREMRKQAVSVDTQGPCSPNVYAMRPQESSSHDP